MPEFEVTFIVVTDAPDRDEAVADAKDLISQRRFEPVSVEPMTDEEEIITLRFTTEDVYSVADEFEIDRDDAYNRATRWADAIRDTASSLISDQLSSVIQYDTP